MLDLLLLYYADDTIILADSAIGLQFALEELQTYCEGWKLVVNEGKTKVMCINRLTFAFFLLHVEWVFTCLYIDLGLCTPFQCSACNGTI